jgi:hypothetical protein
MAVEGLFLVNAYCILLYIMTTSELDGYCEQWESTDLLLRVYIGIKLK